MRYLTINIKSNTEYIEPVVAALSSIVRINNFSKDLLWSLEISLREILANSIIHGNKEDKNKKVSIKFQWDNKVFTIIVKDEGKGFLYTKKEPEELKEGEIPTLSGRGWIFVENKMDFLNFKKYKTGFKIIAKKYIN